MYMAQHIYAALYIASLALTCVIYGNAGDVPNWVLLLLPLSKRLHSIYVLRLFNDCWAVLAVHVAVILYQSGLDEVATMMFRCAFRGHKGTSPDTHCSLALHFP